MGLVARYQRKGSASEKKKKKALLVQNFRRVDYLSACLRFAVALNRTRFPVVKDISLEKTEKGILINITVDKQYSFEIEKKIIGRDRSIFEKHWGIRIAKVKFKA